MKAVDLLVNSMLPEDVRADGRKYTVGDLNDIMYQVATRHPDKFDDVLRNLSNLGRKASYYQGETITLKDLATPFDKKALFDQMDAEIDALPKDKQFKQKRREIYQKYNQMMEKLTSENALKQRNNISMSVLSGARGKSAQLKAMITSPGTYSDYKGNPIDVFSRESFAEGITPTTFAASSFGTRASTVSTKVSTAKGGDWSKQMAQVAADMVVRKEDCGTSNGRILPTDDDSLKGRVLVRAVAGFKPGTFITRDVIAKLKKEGIKDIEVRSPMTCGVHNGLCAKCVGKYYNGGKLPIIGQHIGATAASVAGEPVTQMALSAKHTAGMTQAKKTYSGLGVIQQFTQSPEKFKDEGTVATHDGRVEKIEEAPQGGTYVTVGGKRHYILPGHEVEVKEGQTVEAGDQLAEGLVDPEDIVKYKGLGEGRRYWADRLNKILADSGAKTDKRNTEVLARAAIRHVRVTSQDGMGDYLPDDVVDYNALQSTYKPNETTKTVKTSDAVGSYLQRPVLHYTVGTRITPNVAKFIKEHGHDTIDVDGTAPGFTPEMIRLRTASHANEDWLASQGTSYLAKQLNEASTEGDDTNVLHNSDWRPRLAYGAGFGKNIEETGEF